MALTIALTTPGKSPISAGALRVVTFTVDWDTSYTTGGKSLTAANLGLSRVDFLNCSPTSGVIFEYDYANALLKALFPTGGSGTPAAALGVPLVMSGASTASAVSATTPALAPGVGAQVANAQNLSTLTGVRGFALGI